MKAKDWEFDDNFKASREDITAEGKAREEFVNRHFKDPGRYTQLEVKIRFFIHGFHQGIAWAKAKYDIETEPPEPGVVYALGVREDPDNYGMIGGPWPSKNLALEFVPGAYNLPVILLRMEDTGKGYATYEPTHRWHEGQQRWRPIKRRE
jgi:hypothetical protein